MFATVHRNSAVLLALTLAGCLLALAAGPASAAMPVKGGDGIVFTIDAPGAREVTLAGDFNGWNAADLALQKDAAGAWSVTVALEPGTYEYKYVVDGEWREDPANPQKKADPFGGSNSVLTVNADGTVAGGGAVAAATPKPAAAAAAPADRFEVGAPRAVDGGILFTYRADGASRVTLAGSFNGWNADDTPLETDGKGNWSVVKPLDAGSYEYKFVADGNWQADPENPSTKADPYGGVNSLVTVDDKGKVIAAPAAEAGGATGGGAGLQGLETRATIDGRYLTRFQYAKNVPVSLMDENVVDPRSRLQRPTQSVDLNIRTEVSDAARTMTRLRMDSDQNVIQNNVAAILDEAFIEIHPRDFVLRAYWNQEIFTSGDLLKLGGDIDLPGTIMPDHLNSGKGTAGTLFTADPLGVHTVFWAANVYNYDYYNDPDLFDNLGLDKFALRLSRPFGRLTVGLPVYVERSLVWLDFGSLTTGMIPALDRYRVDSGDNSTWYEVEDTDFNGGIDLAYDTDGPWSFAAEALYTSLSQRFATGNQAGQNNTNGSIDVPFFERDETTLAAQVSYRLDDETSLALLHENVTMTGADPEERLLFYSFLPQATANKQIQWNLGNAPVSVNRDSTELRADWAREDRSLSLWLRRTGRSYDYGVVGEQVPADSTLTSLDRTTWYLAGKATLGVSSDARGHFELETGYTADDRGVAGLKHTVLEAILRWDRDLTRNVGLIADLRYVRYHSEGAPDGSELQSYSTDYFNPFCGFRYAPIRRLNVVLAYGVDPVDFSIDYDGRQIGRWMYRQAYLWDHPDATYLDAENYLKKARVITLRAQMTF